ncbi:hypothetical protein [Nocardia niwae]|uniref:Uncharacterized protein n=1 Tax=Nocardia niwae TaxID=626084 RepID=A0ABV2X3H6_9NOCA
MIAVLTPALAEVTGHVPAARAVLGPVTRLGIYMRVAKPVNTRQTAAARSGVSGRCPQFADAVGGGIDLRVGLRFTALAALGAANPLRPYLAGRVSRGFARAIGHHGR